MKSEFVAEAWKVIEGYCEAYEISNMGRVRSYTDNGGKNKKDKPPKILKTRIDRAGYYTICLKSPETRKQHTCSIHRLVALAFVDGFSVGLHAAHLDGNKVNNDPSNLKWCSPKENISHRKIHGTEYQPKGTLNKQAILNEETVKEIRDLFKNGQRQAKLAEKYQMSRSAICHIVRYKSWSHL